LYALAAALGVATLGLVLASNEVSGPYKLDIVAILVLLAGLPWIARGRGLFGPPGDSQAGRVVRAGGYVFLSGLVLVVFGTLRFKSLSGYPAVPPPPPGVPPFDQRGEDIQLSAMFFAIVAIYTVALLFTTRKRSTVEPSTLAIAGGSGLLAGLVLCSLVPLGGFRNAGALALTNTYSVALVLVALAPPLLAGALAARWAPTERAGRKPRIGIAQGIVAGLVSGAGTALVLTVVTLATMLLFSGHVVPGTEAGPDPARPQMLSIARTIGSASGTLLFEVMTLAVLVGMVLGAVGGSIGAAARRRPRVQLAPTVGPAGT
jgi:hypothetical protein